MRFSPSRPSLSRLKTRLKTNLMTSLKMPQSSSHAENTVIVLNRQRKFPVDRDALATAAARVLQRLEISGQELNVVLLSDRNMRIMNRDYRGVDATTDVISFPMKEGDWGDPSGTLLGDIALSLETIARQSKERFDDQRPQTGTPRKELALMTIHGILHLLGHDHESGGPEATRMLKKESELFTETWNLFPEF